MDTGASRTVLRRLEFERLCKETGRKPLLRKGVELTGVTGHEIRVLGSTELKEVQLGVIPVVVVEGIGHALILGRDVMRQLQATVNYDRGVLSWKHLEMDLLPPRENELVASLGERPPLVRDSRIGQCVEQHQDLFAAKGEHLGCHPEIQVRIETDGAPIKRRPYRLPLTKRNALDRKIEELLEQGVIVPSSSPWASPVVLVQKKDPTEGPRFCVDYTALNKVTKKDAYPIPLIRDIFDQLHGASVFSTLDLKSGFHQLPVHPEDQEKTAFVCHAGLYQWTRMPMGLSNASQLFQRAMEVVFKGLIGRICMLYIDDIVIYSKTEVEHEQHLQTMFDRLRQYNLRLNPTKCVFGLRQVKLLGYIVSSDGLRADTDKVAAIARMQAPQNLADARSFLGMTGYYRSCIRDYAHIAEPLVHLTRKNIRFAWGQDQQEAFDKLKEALVSDQVMAHPRTDAPYQLYTDACDYAIGAILCQKDETGMERPIVYLSKQLSETQRRWATIEKEAYAVIHALKQLRPYLWGASYRTFTDHKPLTSLFTKDMNNTKIQRWSVLLAEYGCNVEYHKGKLNVRADMLSRIRQRDEVSTFDANYWQLGDQLPNMPEDDPEPDAYGLDLRTLARQQREMREWTEHHDEDSQYVRLNDLLYSTQRPYKYAPDHPRLVLPEPQRAAVIKKAHEDVGHMSVVKTMRKLQEAFAWACMKSDVRRHVETCPTCIVHSKKVVHAPMGQMPIATTPMQFVGMDLIGPLVKTPHGNQYILTLIDHCTGWAEAFPIPQKTSQEVWKKLTRQFFPRHGYPDVIITDQGLEFGALALRQYLAEVSIEQRRTTSYNPQANGKCERFNGTLKHIITKLINNNRSDWEDKLGPALLAYNNSASDVTGSTPFFLHHGRRARLPLSKLLRPVQQEDDRLQHLADALRTAASATQNAREHNRDRLARKANTKQLEVGDTVVIKAPEALTLTSKWDPQWTVTKIKGKVVWLTHQQTQKQKVLNVNKLRLVDPNIAWDEVNPRPIRNPRQGARRAAAPLLDGRLAPAPLVDGRLAPAPTTDRPTSPVAGNSGGGPQLKRRRQESHSSTDSGATIIYEYPEPPSPSHSQTGQPPTNTSKDSTAHRNSDRARPSLPRAVKRPEPTDTGSPLPQQQAKRTRRAGEKRPETAEPATSWRQAKKAHRDAPKRGKQEGTSPPDLPQQKKAKLDAIMAVKRFTWA